MRQSAGGLSQVHRPVRVGVYTRTDMLLTRNPNRKFQLCGRAMASLRVCTVSLQTLQTERRALCPGLPSPRILA